MWQALLVSTVALWLLVIFLGLVLLGLIRALARREDSAPTTGNDDGVRWGAPVAGAVTGQPIPQVAAVDAAGQPVDVGGLVAGRSAVVLFVSPSCRQCAQVLDTLQSVHALFGGVAEAVVLVCAAAADRCAELANQPGLGAAVVLDTTGELAAAWGVQTLFARLR